MFALVLTICLTNGQCYDHAPESYSTVKECWTEYEYLIESDQVQDEQLSCVYIDPNE